MSSIRMRVRGPSATVVLEAATDWTLEQLLQAIREKTGVQSFTLKTGFPPTTLDLADAASTTLGPLQLNGAAIMLVPTESGASAPESAPAPSTPAPKFTPKGVEVDETVVRWPERMGFLLLRVMLDDNSCMFTSFGGAVGIQDPAEMRARVAEHILARPETFSKVILDNKEPAEYVRWLQDPQHWGGAIELQCLSEIYDIEICSVDVKSGRVDTFGLNKETRCILLYSGVHYDRIVQAYDPGQPVEIDVTQWKTNDEEVLDKAKELARKLKDARYYTDMQAMPTRCTMPGCENWLGSGQKDMIEHTKKTGHTKFSELILD